MTQHPIELILARQLASQLAVAVLLVDAAGDTVFFNEAAEPFSDDHLKRWTRYRLSSGRASWRREPIQARRCPRNSSRE